MRQRFNDRVIGAAAATAVVAAVAYAAIPDANGVIHACYSTGGLLQAPGALRVIDSGQTCRNGEIALDWNIRGPAGPTGPTGPRGPAGPSGAGPRTFGDSVFQATAGLNFCHPTTVITIPISVGTLSRIYVQGSSGYFPLTTGEVSGQMHVELRNAADTITLATTNMAFGKCISAPGAGPTSGQDNSVTLVAGGMLRSGADPASLDSAAPQFVAAPGEYVLKMIVRGYNGPCTETPITLGNSLSYLLLGAE